MADHPGKPPMAMGGMPGGGRRIGPKIKAKNTRAAASRLWKYLGRQRTGLIIVCILAVITAVTTLIGPYLLGFAVDHYIIERDMSGLLKLCLILLVVYVCGAILTWMQTYVMVGVAQRTVWEMRSDLFSWLQKLPLSFFDSKTNGELMSRTTNDIDNVSQTLNQSVTQILSSIFTLIGACAIMFYLSLWLTLVTLLTIPLMLFLTKNIAKFTRKHFSGQQKQLGELNGFIEESVSGQKVIKIFRREQTTKQQFHKMNMSLRSESIKAQILSGFMGPVMNVVNNLSFALIAAIGGWMAFHELTSVGIVVSFLNYSKQFNRPVNELANQFNQLQSGLAGAERVFEVLDMRPEYQEEPKEDNRLISSPIQKGKVEFQDVSFAYKENEPILKQVTFTAEPGKTIALVGPTGAGKTTIINLLTRFYDVQQGSIMIDGQDIRRIDKLQLRSQLGIVLQDAYLFSDTIRENIRYGKLEASDEEVEAAAKLANAHSFVQKLPDGYDTTLTAAGGNLSHGQRQLITIARAILANPAILILDEATSSIDTRTEMYIQNAMKSLMNGRTSFVIAHRLSTIREADKILVIDHGEIIEQGNHEELMKEKGFYYRLYSSQFKHSVV